MSKLPDAVAFVFVELCLRLHNAAHEGDTLAVERLTATVSGLRDEFSEPIEALLREMGIGHVE